MIPITAMSAPTRKPSTARLAWIVGIAVLYVLPSFLVGQLVDERRRLRYTSSG